MRPKYVLYPCLACIALLSACSHDLAPQNHYQSNVLIIDGDASDWQTPLRYSNSSYTLSYNITNDERNIYLCMITKDEQMQRRILKAGVDIYFDARANKSKTTDLTYPERNTRANGSSFNKNQLLLEADTYNVSGFLNTENGQYSSADKMSAIKVALKFNNDSSLVYEAAIPLNTVLKDGLTKKTLRKNFSIGIVVGTLAESHPPNGRYNDQSMAGGSRMQPRIGIGGGMRGMGMGMGGMRGGFSRRGGSANTNANRPKEEALWNTFSFADKQQPAG